MTHYDAISLADALREHIRGERIAHLTVSSNSMTPLIKKGDVIGLAQVESSQIRKGLIITFTDRNDAHALVTHRISASRQDDQGEIAILTRGDHMLSFDRPLKVEDVVGQVVWRIRDGRKLRLDQGSGAWLSEQLGLIAEFERLQISGMPLEGLQLKPAAIKATNQQTRLYRNKPSAKLKRGASRTWSNILAAAVLQITTQEAATAAGAEQ